ncbi:hypothetical protein I553_0730 [Mycobacterium xenopi 4042]|uniref:Uncharacterized protein n=1 Tax=Mycobacterium xenopi 4042 TaxID=1299334 RepID=X7YJL7_MYCXE|nr:hypothetical protein I553_0730 [Mycobacterium xenopi 4042]
MRVGCSSTRTPRHRRLAADQLAGAALSRDLVEDSFGRAVRLAQERISFPMPGSRPTGQRVVVPHPYDRTYVR